MTRATAATATGITAFVTVLATGLTERQRGLADASDAELSGWVMAGAVVAGVVAAGIAAVIVPGRRVSSADVGVVGPDAPRVALTPGSPVAWARTVAFLIRVGVDENGLTVRGRLGWPRSHVPLDKIGHANVQDVRPLRDFGGYGYRIAAFGPLRGARGYVLRGGPALVVQLTDGGRVVVVVDGAETAAGLLNSLVERQRSR